MAGNMGLFMNPQQVQLAEAMQRSQGLSQQHPLLGGLFNAGHAMGNAGQRFAGADTRSPDEKQQETLHQVMQGVDMTSPTSVFQKARELGQAGNFPATRALIEHAKSLLSTQPKGKGTFQKLLNPETGQMELNWFEGGVNMGSKGITADKKDEKWQYNHTVRLPNNEFRQSRVHPTREGGDAIEIMEDGKWVPAPTGTVNVSTGIQERPPINRTPGKFSITHIDHLVKEDPVLGSTLSGLSLKDRENFSRRVSALAKKKKNDDRFLDDAVALDLAFQEGKENLTKSGKWWGINMKTPEEIQNSTNQSRYDGFSIVP